MQFEAIFRRAFASRVFPPSIVQKLGIKHVKGMLLYGPPGTGKTLIARQIGKMLNGKEPKVVNGPEVLNKYVGQTEENIRNLFAEADSEYKEKGDNSELHIIIFDEIDAICKSRGSVRDGSGVHDTVVSPLSPFLPFPSSLTPSPPSPPPTPSPPRSTVLSSIPSSPPHPPFPSQVNQLLTKIDGVDALNNILLIGMTNRKDMLDEALLRPGRLEVQIEVGLPDEKGRLQILKIHTNKVGECVWKGGVWAYIQPWADHQLLFLPLSSAVSLFVSQSAMNPPPSYSPPSSRPPHPPADGCQLVPRARGRPGEARRHHQELQRR